MNRERPRATRPSLERLETRQLPSAALYLAAAQARLARLGSTHQLDTGSTSVGVPTPREARHEQFVAKFTATYITGPPQLTNESLRISFIARRGGSNQFLHGVALVAINLAADPTQSTTRATASIYPQNIATTGSALILDLSAAPSSSSKPTHLNWRINGSSGGLYSNAVATVPGTLDIKYLPNKKLPGGFESGNAILIFHGQILTTGTGNIARANL